MISGQSISNSLGPLELLVIQPTPFCNIDCSYCYLPHRQSTNRMSLDVLEQTFRWVFDSGLVREPFTLLWHAGEPLVVPIEFYRQAVDLLDKHNDLNHQVDHAFQTNATLITKEWCEFILEHDIKMGVSVDGPPFLHDRYRRTRQGKGTFESAMRGVELLREHNIGFYVISVITGDTLDYPDELFDFYLSHEMTNVAFNMEEIEGPNTKTSLQGRGMEKRFRRFLERFVELSRSIDPPLRLREFENPAGAIMEGRFAPGMRTQENKPWGILSVDHAGNFSTYSPELLGIESSKYGRFVLGNVATDSLEDVMASEKFQLLERDIAEGVRQCQETCEYFPFCGGGPPGNKYFENGTFACTETLSCRLDKKMCVDVALEFLERQPCQSSCSANSSPMPSE
ncbi:MAG: cyclophane-forming radical SAM/SPASM peptide maturase GrrM/OscB [Gemmataceae bacterium]